MSLCRRLKVKRVLLYNIVKSSRKTLHDIARWKLLYYFFSAIVSMNRQVTFFVARATYLTSSEIEVDFAAFVVRK